MSSKFQKGIIRDKEVTSVPNHIASECYIKYKNKIKRKFPTTGRNFFTYDYFSDDVKYSCSDFVFLSKKRKIVYRCFMTMCQEMLISNANDVLWHQEFAELWDKYNLGHTTWIPAERDVWGKPKTYTMEKSNYDVVRPEFGNRDFFDYSNFRVTEYLEANKPNIYEEYQIGGYLKNCLSLHMIVDEPCITEAVVTKHINKFLEMGEVNWKSKTPVPQNKLLYSHDWRKKLGICLGVALDDEFLEELNLKIK